MNKRILELTPIAFSELSENDYIEIVWQSDDTTMLLPYVTASGNLPEIPSVIATLTQVS
jgi:hypothetical protein